MFYSYTAQGQVPSSVYFKTVPPSPNTASLGVYGQVPISLNTGLPEISVPIHEIKAKDMTLPVDISYHGGGIRVEEAASWVGLGFSLSAGGVITREMRAIPDEVGAGYINSPYNSDLIQEGQEEVGYTGAQKTALLEVIRGMADTEPDMFYFNFAGRSGRFVYNKEMTRFETIPSSKMKISYNSASNVHSWTFVDEGGVQYTFSAREINSSGYFCQGVSSATDAVTSGWYLTSMINANRTDTIQFHYTTYPYQFKTVAPMERQYVFTPDQICGSTQGPQPHVVCLVQNTYIAQRLDSITHRSGSVVFSVDPVRRCDINGEFALDKIAIYNERHGLVTTYKLNHTYFGASDCSSGAAPESSRLRLNSIDKTAGGKTELYRGFGYVEGSMPSRLSMAQDYWGYYNGFDTNKDLIPDVTSPDLGNGPVVFEGAERKASTVEYIIQTGTLNKITYPTGGYTLFEYENHRVKSATIQEYGTGRAIVRQDKEHHLTGPGNTKKWGTTFTLNYPPSEVNHNQGGAFVNIEISPLGCDFGPVASPNCAVISLEGPPGAGGTITHNKINDWYLPNGDYTFIVDFSRSDYDTSYFFEMYIDINWQYVNQITANNSAIGGLRVKKITDFDPVTNKAARVRSYSYTLENDGKTSSALLLGTPIFARNVKYWTSCDPFRSGGQSCSKYLVTGTPSYPLTGMGSPISYSFVRMVESSVQGTESMTKYDFMNHYDVPYNYFPYSPSASYDWQRGQVLRERVYAIGLKNSAKLVKQTLNTYRMEDYHVIRGIRADVKVRCDDPRGSAWSTAFFDFDFYAVDKYEMYAGYIYNDQTIVTTYDPLTGDSLRTVEVNREDPENFVQIRKEFTDSDGSKLIDYFKYINDYSAGSSADSMSAAMALQKERNINALVEQTSWRKRSDADSVLTGATLNLYSKETSNRVLLKSVWSIGSLRSGFVPASVVSSAFQFDEHYDKKVEYVAFDNIGNVVELREKDGVPSTIIWNSSRAYPLAVVRNASHDQVSFQGFEESTSSVTTADAHTGARSHTGSYGVFRPTSSGTFNVSYWRKLPGDTEWQSVQTTIDIHLKVIEAAGTLVDDVRVYPPGAQMITYTYDPGVGITSTTDQNNMVTYYKYDLFSRLLNITDYKKNMVKSFEYKLMTTQP
jgi:YD repeat-containing protein